MPVKFWLFISSLCCTVKHYSPITIWTTLTCNHVETIHYQFFPQQNHYRNFLRSEIRLHPLPFQKTVEMISPHDSRDRKQNSRQTSRPTQWQHFFILWAINDLSLCCCGCFVSLSFRITGRRPDKFQFIYQTLISSGTCNNCAVKCLFLFRTIP